MPSRSSGHWSDCSGEFGERGGHPRRDYYQHKRAAGKTHKEAMRCLKRRLSDVVYRTMIKDTETSLLLAG
ncbi:hypothetical protein [Micromonospora sp. KC606]|uniref:hypothetical protein n=1 Tax=Micromonospora sp. KC606 TaxID=2530379 RepID=UPI001A9D173C|nr:hypothetical protein [Micromonospora sp. KC606]